MPNTVLAVRNIYVRYNYVTDMVESAKIQIAQISKTAEVYADFLTKPLGPGDSENSLLRVIIVR